jgi:hypothetical protein
MEKEQYSIYTAGVYLYTYRGFTVMHRIYPDRKFQNPIKPGKHNKQQAKWEKILNIYTERKENLVHFAVSVGNLLFYWHKEHFHGGW